MKGITNEFIISGDNFLDIYEYSDIYGEEIVSSCQLKSIDDICIVIKRIIKCNDIDEYEKILSILPFLRDYNNINAEIDNFINKESNDSY